MRLTVGSVFSGIGGFDEGFRRAGLETRWLCEQNGFCQTVMARHFPDVPMFDDVTTLADVPPVDVLCGGFPCQDVSVAGRRVGLKGERSGLFFAFRDLAARLRPTWVVIENVPGLLSSHGGRDFHTVLAEMAECGFQPTYRILDSRYFGVAQRRRRVFLVLRLGGSGECARTVLFESPRGSGRVEAGDQAGAHIAATLRGRSARRGVNEPGRGGEDDSNLVAIGVRANQRGELRTSPVAGSLNSTKSGTRYEGVAFALRRDPGGIGQGHNTNFIVVDPITASEGRTYDHGGNNTGKTYNLLIEASSGERARALTASMHKRHDDDTDTLVASALTASAGHHGHSSPRGDGRDNIVPTLLAPTGGPRSNNHFQPTQYGVRRLTPLECERVQGFPDGWTCLCGNGHRGSRFCECADSPRYKALGNAVTVPVAEWIGRRILEAEAERLSA